MSAASIAENARRPAHLQLVRSWPSAFSLIEPHPTGLVTFDALEPLAARCATLIDGREFDLSLSVGSYPPFQAVPLITVWASATGQPRAFWLAAAALLGPDPGQDVRRLRAAITAAKRGH